LSSGPPRVGAACDWGRMGKGEGKGEGKGKGKGAKTGTSLWDLCTEVDEVCKVVTGVDGSLVLVSGERCCTCQRTRVPHALANNMCALKSRAQEHTFRAAPSTIV
jgi:hypothetical protein